MGALLRRALAYGRMREAFEKVAGNQGQAGVDGEGIDAFQLGLDGRLKELAAAILGGRYRPSPLKRVWLPRPGKTPRPLGIPTVTDRVAQTAVALLLTPLLEAEFEECSYAYRQGRSVRMAVERIGLLQRQGYRWVVEADIERFFDRIPHDRLLLALRAIAPDDELLALIRQWLEAPVQEGERLTPVLLGVPQGSPISPLLANLYLDHLDEALLDDGHALVRYADDFVVLAKSRERAEAAVELSAEVLHDLELRLNPLKTRVVNFETGFKFLGWNFVRSLAVPARRGVQETTLPAGPPAPSASSKEPFDTPASSGDGAMAAAFAEALAETPAWRPDDAPEEQREDSPEPSVAGIAPSGPDIDAPEPLDTTAPWTAPIDGADLAEPEDEEDQAPPLPSPSLQRTLYLVDPAASLATEDQHLLVRNGDETLLDLPAVNVDQVMLFGRNTVTTAAMVCCLRHGIPVAFLSRMGKYYGRLEPPDGEAHRLLAAQFAAHALGGMDLAFLLPPPPGEGWGEGDPPSDSL